MSIWAVALLFCFQSAVLGQIQHNQQISDIPDATVTEILKTNRALTLLGQVNNKYFFYDLSSTYANGVKKLCESSGLKVAAFGYKEELDFVVANSPAAECWTDGIVTLTRASFSWQDSGVPISPEFDVDLEISFNAGLTLLRFNSTSSKFRLNIGSRCSYCQLRVRQ